MEAKTNYTIIGVAVLILITGILSTMLWLSVGYNQKTYSIYTVYLREAAAGLSKDAPVKFNGVQVGYVRQISLNKNDPRQVELLLNIEEGTPITTSTTATLISQGITGVTYIGLSADSSNLTPLKKLPGEAFPVIPAKPSLFNQLDSLLKEVSVSVNHLSTQAQHVFNEENATQIRKILLNVEQFTAVIAKNQNRIDDSIKNADLLLANTAKASKDFQKSISQFNSMAVHLSEAGTSVSSAMGSGRSTMDKLSQETIAPMALLLRRLTTIAVNLEKVSSELRQNPSVILRGSTAPKPGPGE